MARRRMIDPNFWQSEDVSKLTIRQRLLLIGLFSNADDYGKGRAKPTYIRSIIFPYDDISLKEIESDLAVISKNISITFYNIEGNSYYKLDSWENWQTVQKPQRSNIPAPSISSKNLVENDSITILDQVENDSLLKERKGKEIEVKRKEEKGKEVKEEKTAHAEFVTLSESEYQKLLLDYGEEDTQKLIEILNNYKGANGKTYKSDYLAILNWVIKRLGDEKAKVTVLQPKDKLKPDKYNEIYMS